jgi:hypothetical protein
MTSRGPDGPPGLAGGGHFFPGLHLARWTSIAILAASGALVGLLRGR